MKRLFLLVFITQTYIGFSQTQKTYQAGERLTFRVHYGWFNASYATLEIKNETYNGQDVYHVVGKGKSTGLLDLFFKVDDNYETYIRKTDQLPVKFVRKISEGGYTKHREIYFDQEAHKSQVYDIKHNRTDIYTTQPKVQDMLSVFYYFRDKIDPASLKKGDEVEADLFFDNENYHFKTVFLGRERIKTKFGKVTALKFRPYVQAGRVFKGEESLLLWVSDDGNRVPLKIKAKLAVGSLEADLDEYKGLKHPVGF